METPAENASAFAPRRFHFVDTERGYLMLLVVCVHVLGGIQNAGIALPHAVTGLIDYAYSFFMPAMFLLSGLFIESAIRKGVESYALSRLRTLAYPFVLWTAINAFMLALGSTMTNHRVILDPAYWLVVLPPGPMWFLEALIVSQFLYGALRFARLEPWIVAVVGVVGTFASTFMPGAMVARSLYAFGFLALGSVLGPLLIERLPQLGKSALVALGVACAMLHFAMFQIGWTPHAAPAVALLGGMHVYCFSAAFGGDRRLEWLRKVGTASLAIFVMHVIVAAPIRILLQRGMHIDDPVIHVLAGLAGGLLVPLFAWRGWGKRLPWLFQWPAPYRAGATALPLPSAR